MNIIQFAIENPIKVTAGVILIILFGTLSFFSIPIQLTPDVDQPQITVTTRWVGASPQEIENEIIEPQEEKLKSVADLKKMTSTAIRGEGTINLEFNVGVDKDAALRDTIEKINQVSAYPEQVDRPEVQAADAAMDSPIAWLIFRADKVEDVSTLRDFVEDNVQPLLERVPGVASVDIYGGREREVQVLVDPARLAARGITFRQLEQALRSQNRNISAGTTSLGKREYTYRTVGEYTEVSEVEDTVITYVNGGPVFVGDVAEVVHSHKKQYSFVRSLGDFVLALPVRRETGANVIATMQGLQTRIEEINEQVLAPREEGMSLTQVYDETIYIHSAIDLVVGNIFIGGLLATVVLLLFLRSASATLIVAITIPISVIGAFLMVTVLGRSLNVVMLAGMAFAVGMVVDNAVVVLENIYRHRQLGLGRVDAALKGTREVWGAILASTLTTVAVFLPVIFVEEEAGQLFADIAIAISTAVILSLVIAITVIPTVSSRYLKDVKKHSGEDPGGRVGQWVQSLVWRITSRTWSRLATVLGLTVVALAGSWMLMPPAAYLPNGNRNLVFGFLIVPPGYSIDEYLRMGQVIESQIRPFWQAELNSPEAAALSEVNMGVGNGKTVTVDPPPIDNFFFVSFGGGAFMGCSSKIEGKVSPLVEVFNRAASGLPGVFPFFSQASLFGRALEGGNTVDLELRCDNEAALMRGAGALNGSLRQNYPQLRTEPGSFDIGRPELQAKVNRVKAADLGLNVLDVGFAVEACINGAFVGGFREKGKEIDLVIKVPGTDNASTTQIASTPICTPTGRIVPLSAVVDFELKFEPQEITHSESMKSIRFLISPPKGTALEAAMIDIQENYVAPLRASGVISADTVVSLSGNADKLIQTRRALVGTYTGLFARPSIFGLSPAWTVSLIGLLIVAAAVVLGWMRSPIAGARAGGIGMAALAIAVLALNPSLALELLQSRGMLAAIVTFLLMAALFESFAYPFVIMLTVPLATVGGFAGLAVVHWLSLRNPLVPVQELDVLTMLGFIILIGIVVNNAILIVHQSLNNMRDEGMDPHEAISASVRTRVRPIFMTAMTSIGGMLPLVMMPGSGSELYRGLGSVLVGGLLVATVFTLVVIPAMFSLFVDASNFLRKSSQRAGAVDGRRAEPLEAEGEAVPAVAGHR